MRQLLESVVGHPVEDAAIRASIGLYNEVRRLVRRTYEIRHESPWLISATESYAMVRAGTLMPVDEYLPLLREFVSLAGV